MNENKLFLKKELDHLSVLEILKLMNNEDQKVAIAVKKEIPKIEKAVKLIINSLKNQGRLFYIGAGTSGRLGILDASECPPTFGTPPSLVRGIIAGGEKALYQSVEGAEDSKKNALIELKKYKFSSKDILAGISASGSTPFVASSLEYAKSLGADTIAITSNPKADITKWAKVSIIPLVGIEIIRGSTRLKAGTAQKLVLNMLSTAAMIKLGKVYGNYMVSLMPVNLKLKKRSLSMLQELSGLNQEKAQELLRKAKGNIKIALLMHLGNFSKIQADGLLKQNENNLRKALEFVRKS
ncbi:MAG: N-acetylmuramic acid 6-phosphate etherase [Armatimonadetes bacterium]|nr:N-acetylmuramic acid 6-phosphate etherase [Armatimonadota bacterium]